MDALLQNTTTTLIEWVSAVQYAQSCTKVHYVINVASFKCCKSASCVGELLEDPQPKE